MSPVVRPTYTEGQILGAADLNAQLTYERLGMVLHERTEHLWGVAQGLALQTTNQTQGLQQYVDVSVAPGRAVDRLGRAIVVTEAIPLDAGAFHAQFPSATPKELYPVFVQAIEVPKQGETQPGKCGVAPITRIEEGVQISFGSPGAEISVLDPPATSVADGFGTPTLTDMVLVGWVVFDNTNGLNKFTAVKTESSGIKIRYVGVVASDVVASGGELTLHTQPSGSRFALAILEDGAGGCLLEFGKQDGNSPVVPVFSVDEKGNVSYTGTLTPTPIAKTAAESGVIFDGITLPLPAGVDDQQVSTGDVRLHVQLAPVPQPPRTMILGGTAKLAFPLVIKCSVDVSTDRIVHCQVRWYDPTAGDPTVSTSYIDVPGSCTYMVIATGK